jgi:transposase
MSQDSSNASTRGKESLSKVDAEVKVKPERRQFTAEYKLRILKEADNCTGPGQICALLRREGLYSSNLTQWRQQRSEGVLEGLAPQETQEEARSKGRSTRRGERRPPSANRSSRDGTETRRDHHRGPKKVSELLGLSDPSNRKSDENK